MKKYLIYLFVIIILPSCSLIRFTHKWPKDYYKNINNRTPDRYEYILYSDFKGTPDSILLAELFEKVQKEAESLGEKEAGRTIKGSSWSTDRSKDPYLDSLVIKNNIITAVFKDARKQSSCDHPSFTLMVDSLDGEVVISYKEITSIAREYKTSLDSAEYKGYLKIDNMPVLVIGNATDIFFESVGKIYVGIPYPSPYPFPYEVFYKSNEEMRDLFYIDFWIYNDDMLVKYETIRKRFRVF